ncbi:hypothetical protein SAMN04488116_3455 [Flagellimonas flava]|uniref:Uncharacterized protein n=1 Tax=Flagellimonas flava TaxID=570519 RepID=A0A1M5Q2A2_9FLAO|nr:hypothetical protein SAMN04488116_3455 [Allomuricauda flava]
MSDGEQLKVGLLLPFLTKLFLIDLQNCMDGSEINFYSRERLFFCDIEAKFLKH